MSNGTAYLIRNAVSKTRKIFCFILNFFILISALTGLILNSIHFSRSSSDSVVTGLWSHRKIVVCFPAGTRNNSVLYFLHTVSYRVERTPSLFIKRPEREADHHLLPRAQRGHAIMPTFFALPLRVA
jgi:hypothetical protein